MDNVLEVRDLHFTYSDGYEALKGISIKLARGEFAGLLGSNGCGKTTFFQTLNGLLKPTSGEVAIKGKRISDWKENELYKTVGLVFQNPDDQLFAPTVFEDISYGLINMGLEYPVVKEKVETALKLLKIWEIRNKPVHNLSYGQKKRVAIAGVLAMEPELLILDEPTAGLDPMGVSELMNLLKEVQQKLKITVLISTHDIDIVPLYCDRIYVISKGKVVLEGTPEEVFSKADMIRSVNLRLPRISHLMEILNHEDHIEIDTSVTTISGARKAIKKVLKDGGI